MAEEQIQELKSKLEAQAQEFQNYKVQCKQLEEFLQDESNKKQQEIRKLKEESIKKEKNYGLLKAQVSQLEAQNLSIKAELKEKEGNSSNAQGDKNKINELNKTVQTLQKQATQLKELLSSTISSAQAERAELNAKIKSLSQVQNTLGQKEKIIKQLQSEINKLNQQLSKKSSSAKVQEKISTPQKIQKIQKVQKTSSEVKSATMNNDELKILKKQLAQSKIETQKAQQQVIKLSKQLKQLKQKSHYLSADRQKLVKKVKDLSRSLSAKQQFIKEQNAEEFHQQSEVMPVKDSLSINALIMTKKHYVSPFLELKGDNIIKMYKSTKNGCFEKSLGSTKFKVNQISYDAENIVNQCCKTIIENFNNKINSSIIFYGAKKTSKKYLMAHVIERIREEIVNWVDGSQNSAEACYIKASQDAQKKANFNGKDREEILEIIDKVVELGQKSPKKADKFNKKKVSKPKIRYLRLTINQTIIQLITSSHTNISNRSLSLQEYLNNICYSKLPNVLQHTDTNRILILTINPIVSLYEDCKNTLDIVNYKKAHNVSEVEDWHASPMGLKQQIFNESAKKKFQSIERQTQQNSLKIRRLEEEISFYRSKFDELEVRLKNLLNTHGVQNTYLKKSPVTLSYEKMLKFVHSVLARNGQQISSATMKTSEFHHQQGFSIDEGYASGEEIL